MKIFRCLSAAAVTLILAGCTTSLQVKPLSAMDPNRSGISYVLPFTQYQVTQTWRLSDCTPGAEKVGAKVEATIGQADDGSQAYLIDPASLERMLTVSEFKATFAENGNMLKSVNASVEDRTGQFIGNVVKTAVSLAPLAFGAPPLPAPGAAPGAATSACRPQIEAALKAAKQEKAALDTATENVKQATQAVLTEAATFTAMGAAADDATKTRYANALLALRGATEIQAARASSLAEALKPITFQRIVRWPETSDCFQSQAFAVDPEALAKWFTEGTQPKTVQEIRLAIERSGTYGRDPISAATCPGIAPSNRPVDFKYASPADKLEGLRYRAPAAGRLVACTADPCRSQDVESVLLVLEGPVAQLGFVNVLPVRTAAFGSNTFDAQFRPDGGLVSAGYAQKSAPLEGASAAVAASAGQIAPLLDPAKRLDREREYLEALKKRRDAADALEPAKVDPKKATLEALQMDTSLLNAEIARRQAEITLEGLRPPTQ